MLRSDTEKVDLIVAVVEYQELALDDDVTHWATEWDVDDRWAKAEAGDFSD